MSKLNGFGWMFYHHLERHRPKQFRDLQQKGELDSYLLSLQDYAGRNLVQLQQGGLQFHEAWEIVKDDVLLPTEDDVPLLGELPSREQSQNSTPPLRLVPRSDEEIPDAAL